MEIDSGHDDLFMSRSVFSFVPVYIAHLRLAQLYRERNCLSTGSSSGSGLLYPYNVTSTPSLRRFAQPLCAKVWVYVHDGRCK